MIFSEDDTSFSLEAVPLKSVGILYSGLWLVLVGIHEIPPHIALISGGKYYSVSTRKVDCGTSLERFVNTLERKHIPTLFIKMENSGDIIPVDEMQLQSIYNKLQPLKVSGNTCLAPIRDFFAIEFSPAFADVNYVFDLLAIGHKQALIKERVSVFVDAANTNCITLPKYTMGQIKDKIYSLSVQINSANQ